MTHLINFVRTKALPTVVAALFSVSASAQLTVPQPTGSPAQGQTLLEWVNPPLLSYEIPLERRSDLSTCVADRETQLDAVVRTCDPLLQAAKLFLRMDFTAQETIGDRRRNQDEALRLADELIATTKDESWPLQTYFLMKAFEQKALIYQKRGDHAAAISALKEARDHVFGVRGFDYEPRRLGFDRKLVDSLMELGRREDARIVLENSIPWLDESVYPTAAIPMYKMVERLAVDAIFIGERDYARSILDRYGRDVVRVIPERREQFGRDTLRDLQIYLAAGRGDEAEVARVIQLRTAERPNRPLCRQLSRYFPRVIAPVHRAPIVEQALRQAQCTDDDLKEIDEAIEGGVFFAGKQVLPANPIQ